MAPEGESDVQSALAELAQARQGAYYDEAADAEQKRAYYEGVDASSDPTSLFGALSELLTTTHTTQLEYKPSRHLYPSVDLHPDGRLRSIYTGEVYDPEQLIVEGAATHERRQELAAQRLVGPEALSEEALLGLEAELDQVLPYNCEHVVPQGWFGHRAPMRADLHHLFTCEKECNHFRDSIPYFDFPDFLEGVRSGCGKRDEDRFEPQQGKGEVARATLYFLVRYPGAVNGQERRLDESRLAVLLDWHHQSPVSEYERRRNRAIQAKQGNRNPFIDEPAWAGRVTLNLGLG